MHVVAIHGWQRETPELVQALAGALGVVPFEARQRLVGGGPAVVAGFAEVQAAQGLAQRLVESGLPAVIVDSTMLQADGRLLARRFVLAATALQIETADGTHATFPYTAIDLLLVGIGTVSTSQTQTVTERKFSLGKTLLSGGIPMTSKVARQEEVTSEERHKYLYLYAGERPLLICGQHLLNYEGLGAAMLLTQDANFSQLLGELRRRCSNAGYDDRLLNRQGIARLLGLARNPETDLDLAAAILSRTLRD